MRNSLLHSHRRSAAIFASLCCVFSLAPPPADASVTVTKSSIALCTAGNTSTTFAASSNAPGNPQLNASSSPAGVVNVTPAGNQNATSVTYTVTQVGAGSATISVTDKNHNGDKSIAASVNGPLAITPTSLTFNGTTGSQSITVTDPGPAVSINATSSDPTVATVTASAATDPATHQATLDVTPVNGSKNGHAPASATITISDGAGCPSKTLTVTVAPGALTLSPASLTLAGGGSSKTFTASESDYTGAFSAASDNTQIASVSPATGNGPGPTTFTVSPVGTAFGPAHVTVTDDHGGGQSVDVVVTGGTISAESNNVSFTADDNTNPHLASSPISVTGSMQTTSSGTGQIAVSAPADISGSHGGSLLIGYLTYNCTGSGTGNNQGGAFAGGFLQLIAGDTASPCVTFPSDQYATLNFNVNLFLDDRALPADTYYGSGFQIVLSAT